MAPLSFPAGRGSREAGLRRAGLCRAGLCRAGACVVALLSCVACERSLPSEAPLQPQPSSEPTQEHRFPTGGAADAGVLELEPDEPGHTAGKDGGASWGDAGGQIVQPFTPPQRQLVNMTCEPPGGRTVWFSQARAALGGQELGGNYFEVFEGPGATQSLPGSTRVQFDPQRQRLVRVYVQGLPSARVTSVVETDTRLVVLLDLPAYCGGPAPFSPAFDVVIGRSAKPVAVQGCGRGQCVGVPLP